MYARAEVIKLSYFRVVPDKKNVRLFPGNRTLQRVLCSIGVPLYKLIEECMEKKLRYNKLPL